MEKHFVLIEENDYLDLISKVDNILSILEAKKKDQNNSTDLTNNRDSGQFRDFLTADEAKDFLNLSKRTFYNLVEKKVIPKHVIGGCKRYKKSELKMFIMDHEPE